jgi:hypothetical protein
MDRFHDEWLGMVRPIDGLVVAKQALLDAQVARPEESKELRGVLEKLLESGAADMPRLYAEVLGLGAERWRSGDALDAFSLAVPDTGQMLRPTRGLARSADAPVVALAWDLPAGLAFDERESVTGAWD